MATAKVVGTLRLRSGSDDESALATAIKAGY